MRLPRLQHPERYAGLYVVDFGDTTAVGYTGEEVAMLRESERFAAAKVYRIYRAGADGTLELQAVAGEKFHLEAGVFFYSRELAQARADFDAVRLLADAVAMPCRTQLLLASLAEPAPLPFVVGLAYPAEGDMDISTWLLDNAYTSASTLTAAWLPWRTSANRPASSRRRSSRSPPPAGSAAARRCWIRRIGRSNGCCDRFGWVDFGCHAP